MEIQWFFLSNDGKNTFYLGAFQDSSLLYIKNIIRTTDHEQRLKSAARGGDYESNRSREEVGVEDNTQTLDLWGQRTAELLTCNKKFDRFGDCGFRANKKYFSFIYITYEKVMNQEVKKGGVGL